MRQLLDVTNTITSEEMRDFEMRYTIFNAKNQPFHFDNKSIKETIKRIHLTKCLCFTVPFNSSIDIYFLCVSVFCCCILLSRYGSPHHCRSQSVKAPGRGSGRPNQLSLPQQRSRYGDYIFYIILFASPNLFDRKYFFTNTYVRFEP